MTEAERMLLALYDQASPAVRRRGRSWYPECSRQLRQIADRTGVRPAHAAAVFSIVSPVVQVSTALLWTEEILRGDRVGGRFPNVQAPKIRAALETTRPIHRLNGPKVQPFYRALMGDPDALVLDRWAAFAAGYEDRSKNIPPAVRRQIEAAYRAAAAAVGETVRAFQAIIWIVVRESTPKSNGVLPRLQDVTA
ncbi:MAG TPA: hypothetical protein VLA89_02900 [Gemmatimonadales bacterium]|nr:hypothetical protein [Gemmatimonadales bacterium]